MRPIFRWQATHFVILLFLLGGIGALLLGLVWSVTAPFPPTRLLWPLCLSLLCFGSAFIIYGIAIGIRSDQRTIITGQEGILGCQGTVIETKKSQLMVRVLGELWEAQCSYPLAPGHKIIVTQIDGLLLTVEPIDSQPIIRS